MQTKTKQLWNRNKEMFESRVSAGATEKIDRVGRRHAKTVSWSYDVEGHARKCVERYCELANKEAGAIVKKFQVLAWMIIMSGRRNLNQSKNYPNDAHTLSSKKLVPGTNW